MDCGKPIIPCRSGTLVYLHPLKPPCHERPRLERTLDEYFEKVREAFPAGISYFSFISDDPDRVAGYITKRILEVEYEDWARVVMHKLPLVHKDLLAPLHDPDEPYPARSIYSYIQSRRMPRLPLDPPDLPRDLDHFYSVGAERQMSKYTRRKAVRHVQKSIGFIFAIGMGLESADAWERIREWSDGRDRITR